MYLWEILKLSLYTLPTFYKSKHFNYLFSFWQMLNPPPLNMHSCLLYTIAMMVVWNEQ